MMILNSELQKFISGAIFFEEADGIIPYRFTKEKMKSCENEDLRFMRQRTGAGIKIDFMSDTEEISFSYKLHSKCIDGLYNHYFFDIYADNKLILHQGDRNVDLGTTGKVNIRLKKEAKRITIYLPCSAPVEISEFSISDGATMEKWEYDKKVLFLGDSITHSAYIDFPSMSYSNILARKQNYNILNQAIGGDKFLTEHLSHMPEFNPDMIFVAYGTNDWTSNDPDVPQNTEKYFALLKKLYPDALINVILPIWRRDMNDKPECVFTFSEVREMIREIAQRHGANVIDGLDFVPDYELLWYDGYLHPNEHGFAFYADSLEKKILI